jgi:hypothetical protein
MYGKVLVNISNTKCQENPPRCSPVSCGQADGRTNVTKLTIALCSCFANAPKSEAVSANWILTRKVHMPVVCLYCPALPCRVYWHELPPRGS